MTLAAFRWFHAFNSRSAFRSVFKLGLVTNRWLILAISAAIVLQVPAVHTPVGHMVLGTATIGLIDWMFAVLTASSILRIDELLKLFHIHGHEGGRRTHG